MRDSILLNKSKILAVEMVKMCKNIELNHHERIITTQALKSGTSIGANIREAYFAQSDADFIARLNISLKEANETSYWLEILHETNYINDEWFEYLYKLNGEMIGLLISSIKTVKKRIQRPEN